MTTDKRGVSVNQAGTATLAAPNGVYTRRMAYDAQGDQTSSSAPPLTTTLNGDTGTLPVVTLDAYDADGHRTAATSANRSSTLDAYDHLGRQVTTTEPAVALYNAPLTTSASAAINAGGSAVGVFSADTDYSGGGTYGTGAAIDTSGVISPAPQAVYQTERHGNFSYTVPGLAPGGAYRVRLHFAEQNPSFPTGPGQRVFNVAINGAQVLTNFDIYATAGGPDRAIVEEFTVTADSTGQITVQFTSVVDNAKVNGIEVIPTTAIRETTGYDGDGNAVRTTDALGAVTTSSYDPLGRQVSTTNPVSGTTITTYNATEQVSAQDPQGNITTNQYDAAGRLTQATDALTGTVQYGYDAAGNTTAITTGDTSGGVIQVETRQYDALNRAITDTVSGPGGAPQTTTTRYDLDGNVYQVNQPNGATTVDTYDLADQLITSETDGAPVLSATHQDQTTYRYDAAGNQIETRDPEGRDTATTYDGDSRAMSEVSTTPGVAGTTTMTTTTGYDPNGNTLAQTVQTRDSSGNVQTFTDTATYNTADWTTSTTDNGVTTQYGYDAAGQPRTQTYQNGAATATMALDAEGRLTALGDGAGHTNSFGYNANDQTTAITLPNGVSEQASYDANGRLTAWHDPGPGQNVTYGYDAASRVTSFTAVSGTDTLGYNAQNRLTSDCGPQVIAHSPDHCYHWTYDGTGNISTTTVDAGSPVTYTYTYNPQNNELTTLDAPAYANSTTYDGYDGNGHTTAITSPVNGSLTAPGVINTHLGYNAAGQVSAITLKDGRTIAIMYNAQGQRASYSALSATGQTLYSAQFSYSGGALSQASVVSATAGGSVSYTDSYLYGGDRQPIEFTRVQNGTTNYYWYEYDGRGDVVSVTDSAGNVVDSYEYDLWGEELPDTTHETVPQRLRAGAMWYDAEMQVQWLWDGGTNRYYDPELERYLQPDAPGGSYVFAKDDPGEVGVLPGAGSVGGLGGSFGTGASVIGASPSFEGNEECGVTPGVGYATPSCGGANDVGGPPPEGDANAGGGTAEGGERSSPPPEVDALREIYDRLPQSLKDQIQQFKNKWYRSTLPTQQDTLTYHWNKWARPQGVTPGDYTERAKTFYDNFRNQGHRRGVMVDLHYPLEDGTSGIRITAVGRVGIYKEVGGEIKIVDYYPQRGGTLGNPSGNG